MRNVFRKTLPLLLTLVMLLGAVSTVCGANAPGLQNFTKPNTYSSGDFQDVKETDWFGGVVAEAYAYGLLKGKAPGRFDPNGNITLAEAVTIAARLHSIYQTGAESFQNGTPWYQPYADYALKEGILKEAIKDYHRAATRAEFAHIIRAAFPDKALSQINAMKADAIPDVPSKPDNADIYTLYGAGILTGSDAKGTFLPNSNIRRSEVAAIAVRMVDTTQRKTFTLGLDASADLPATTESKQTVTFQFRDSTTGGLVKTTGITLLCASYEGGSAALKKAGWALSFNNDYQYSAISEGCADLPAGTYTMTAKAPGYADSLFKFTVASGKDLTVQVNLTPSADAVNDADVVFVYPDAAGKLVPLEEGAGSLDGSTFSKFTVRNGKFADFSPTPKAGYYDLEVWGWYDNEGFRWYKQIRNAYIDAKFAMDTVVCEKRTDVNFRAASGGNDVKEFKVVVRSSGVIADQTTTTYGEASSLLLAGSYSFTLTADGYQPYNGSFNLTGPLNLNITLTPDSSTTPTTPTPGTTDPAAKDAVFVYRNDAGKLVPVTSGRGVLMKQDGGPRDYPFTIKDGKFGESTTLPAGTYELEVYEGDTDDNGFTCRKEDVRFGTKADIAANQIKLSQITCDYAAEINLSIKNEQGVEVSSNRVTIQDASGSTVFSSNSGGSQWLYLAKGVYMLRIQADSYQDCSQRLNITGSGQIDITMQSNYAETENGGSCGDNVYWKIENDTLTIYGSGLMTRYDSNLDFPWANQSGKLSSIVVEDGVQSVESLAFTMSSAKTVTFGKDLRFIGYKAFLHCKNLTRVTFTGDAPTVNRNGMIVFAGENVFDCPVTVYHPENNSTWTEEAKEAFGDNVTFVAY